MTANETTPFVGHESSGVSTGGHRVTARLHRDEAGNIHREYIIDGDDSRTYGSLSAVQAALGGA